MAGTFPEACHESSQESVQLNVGGFTVLVVGMQVHIV